MLSLLFATALRECWEEIRLNPLKVTFLGPLPVQKLIMFNRKIYPLAGWVPPNQVFRPNWEVDRMVYIPLRRLLEPQNYARFRLINSKCSGDSQRNDDFPCFIHRDQAGDEVLWGATFRIVMDFLRRIQYFTLPDLSRSTIIQRNLSADYLNGSLIQPNTTICIEREEDF